MYLILGGSPVSLNGVSVRITERFIKNPELFTNSIRTISKIPRTIYKLYVNPSELFLKNPELFIKQSHVANTLFQHFSVVQNYS